MIISDKICRNNKKFEQLLDKSHYQLVEDAKKSPSYYLKRSSDDFEKDVFESMRSAAKKTCFDNTIELVSGFKFPDIVAKKYFGVEVKTVKKNQWHSTGNSVLENTRVEDVDTIYIFFGKLCNPLEFKYRKYQDCLSGVAVTHSPRYLIDMNLEKGKTIFDKIKISYDDLRQMKNPIKPIVNYYRSIAKEGEEPWWMDDSETPEYVISPTVSLWSNLQKNDKDKLIIEAMARFPEIFGTSTAKYQKLASWLAARHGVVDSSLRDRFTAGGKVDLTINKKKYARIPRIFLHLHENVNEVLKIVNTIPIEEAVANWKLTEKPSRYNILETWLEKVIDYSNETLKDSRKFIIHLLGDSVGYDKSPSFLREEISKYRLDC